MDFETWCWVALVIKTVRIVQNTSLECYKNARFKQGSVKYRSGSRSGHKDKVILPNNKSVHLRHVTRGILGVEFDGETYFTI